MSGRVKSFLEKITSQSTVLISIKLVRQITPRKRQKRKLLSRSSVFLYTRIKQKYNLKRPYDASISDIVACRQASDI